MRLLLAQAIVLVAGAVTTGVLAAIVGPPLFRGHLHRAGVPDASPEQAHAEEAYRYATASAVGGALTVSAITALAVTWYISRRLQRSVTELSAAASAVSDGRYDIRVTPPHLGDDFHALSHAFNQMAAQLQAIDTSRRQLFGDLAHEIRTPVSVLEAYMEALEDGIATLTPETIAMLRDQTRRLVRFSGDVAALARLEEGRALITHTWIRPAELIAAAAAAAADRYRVKGVALVSHVQPGLPLLWADPQRLGQVIGNLLDNALRHTPRDGHVELAAAGGGGAVSITVTDTGDGIAAEHLPHLFDRFYRVDTARDRDHGGAGIGLAIAKALVDAHGGRIAATSNGPGSGTTITVTIPLSGERPDAPPPTAARRDRH